MKLSKKVAGCKKCKLCLKGKNAVPGEGPLDAKIILVGEAPGREEDLTGRPFIGRSGKLLTKLLEEKAGIGRKKVFITSVVKHRPPGNRKPTAKETKACLPYLLRQIEIIKPKLIVLLGQTAFSAFFPKLKLKNLRGKFVILRQAQGKKDGRKFFITYHPAAGLRSTRAKKILEKDFKKLNI